jgi:hypothetical protein
MRFLILVGYVGPSASGASAYVDICNNRIAQRLAKNSACFRLNISITVYFESKPNEGRPTARCAGQSGDWVCYEVDAVLAEGQPDEDFGYVLAMQKAWPTLLNLLRADLPKSTVLAVDELELLLSMIQLPT